MKKSFL